MTISNRSTMSFLAIAAALSVMLGAPASLATTSASTLVREGLRPLCQGHSATIVGTADSEELRGTPQRDVIVAGGGDDVVLSGKGADVVCLGDGFDHLRLGPGDDTALGGAGDDTMHGGRGLDTLKGESDVDALNGGPGDDRLYGGRGRAIIVEALVGGPGDDLIEGGPGLDSAQYYRSHNSVHVDLRRGTGRGEGVDVLIGIEGVVGSRFSDVLIGDALGNGLFGQGGDDMIRGGGSGTVLEGTADVLSGDAGDDRLAGGAGEDLVTYNRMLIPVHVDLANGIATGQGADALVGIEAVQGSRFDDTLLGGRRPEHFAGNVGDDTIDGGGGRDTVIFRDLPGPVEVRLGSGTGRGPQAGSDMLFNIENAWGTGADDDLQGDDSRNVLIAFGGDDHLVGFAGFDHLDGGLGYDDCVDLPEETLRCESAPDPIGDERQLSPWPWGIRQQ